MTEKVRDDREVQHDTIYNVYFMILSDSVLGKATNYKDTYDKELLFKIPRLAKRLELGLTKDNIPFYGVDIWNAYEISWLNESGKPCVAIGEFYIPSDSTNMIESKSLKLYLNSFNNTKFSSLKEVEQVICQDLSIAAQSKVLVKLHLLDNKEFIFGKFGGINIDHLNITCTDYSSVDKTLIQYDNEVVHEEINSNLLRSNCLITGQPDWGSILIKYDGKKLRHDSILRYLISFRNHNEFHEQCVERIFTDIFNTIKPSYLSVYARYTRRGGLDICPYRSTSENFAVPSNDRFMRQ